MLNAFNFLLSDGFLVWPLLLILIISFFLTIKLNFIQFLKFPEVLKMLFLNQQDHVVSHQETVSPRSAVLISMSTAIGLGNIAGPVVAIGAGGPAVIVGFIIAAVLGAAVTFLEIFLAVKYRRSNAKGEISGGAMEYLRAEFAPWLAVIYSFALMTLLSFWTASQTNNLTILLNGIGISNIVAGFFLAGLTLLVLFGGIKRLAAVNDKLVPIMSVIYLFCTLSVILINWKNLPRTFNLIFQSLTGKPLTVGGGVFAGISFLSTIRWGIGRAVQANEVGIGTSTFPHSNSGSTNPYYQALLGMAPVFATAILTTITGLTILVTDFWMIDGAQFDISLFFKIMKHTFPSFGALAIVFCGFLFGIGTILGNSYNASRCFIFLFGRRYLNFFYVICAIVVLWGALTKATMLWDLVDFFVFPVAIPHLVAIFIIAFRRNFRLKNF